MYNKTITLHKCIYNNALCIYNMTILYTSNLVKCEAMARKNRTKSEYGASLLGLRAVQWTGLSRWDGLEIATPEC